MRSHRLVRGAFVAAVMLLGPAVRADDTKACFNHPRGYYRIDYPLAWQKQEALGGEGRESVRLGSPSGKGLAFLVDQPAAGMSLDQAYQALFVDVMKDSVKGITFDAPAKRTKDGRPWIFGQGGVQDQVFTSCSITQNGDRTFCITLVAFSGLSRDELAQLNALPDAFLFAAAAPAPGGTGAGGRLGGLFGGGGATPAPPPAGADPLVGTWISTGGGPTYTITCQPDGRYSYTADMPQGKQQVQGKYTYHDGLLQFLPDGGQPGQGFQFNVKILAPDQIELEAGGNKIPMRRQGGAAGGNPPVPGNNPFNPLAPGGNPLNPTPPGGATAPAKLVGNWLAQGPNGTMSMSCGADGRFTFTVKAGQQENTLRGRYEFDGATLTFAPENAPGGQTFKYKARWVDENTLELVGDGGDGGRFVRQGGGIAAPGGGLGGLLAPPPATAGGIEGAWKAAGQGAEFLLELNPGGQFRMSQNSGQGQPIAGRWTFDGAALTLAPEGGAPFTFTVTALSAQALEVTTANGTAVRFQRVGGAAPGGATPGAPGGAAIGNLVGVWEAAMPNGTMTLTLTADGRFTFEARTAQGNQTLAGKYTATPTEIAFVPDMAPPGQSAKYALKWVDANTVDMTGQQPGDGGHYVRKGTAPPPAAGGGGGALLFPMH